MKLCECINVLFVLMINIDKVMSCVLVIITELFLMCFWIIRNKEFCMLVIKDETTTYIHKMEHDSI